MSAMKINFKFTSSPTFTRSTVIFSSIQGVLTRPVSSFVSRAALNFRYIWITKNPVQHLHSPTGIQFLCASLNVLGSSLRRQTKNNSVIKFYHLLKVKLRHIYELSRWHAWFLTHWDQRENAEERPQIREMLLDCTTQDPSCVKSILIIFLNA